MNHLGVKMSLNSNQTNMDREATKDELKKIKESEQMLKEEKTSTNISNVRDLAVTHWRSLECSL